MGAIVSRGVPKISITRITTTLDGQPLYEWTGPIAALSLYAGWATIPPGSLALGTIADDWVVSEVKAKRLEGK